ncbi:MAG: polysaccharide biosynthesis protein [Oscillospiraceae bacterium]|jgi:stage V sporulation protein B|nr:polysaccharide biosynthesis protein [Oscillospiraceae bacterium]
MPEPKKQNFLQGALILSAATALVKIIGALFKIPLSNQIGPEGLAHVTAAYNIYATLFVIATAGLPVAVSKMVSEAVARRRTAEKRAIFRLSLLCFLLIGAVGTVFLFFGARTVAGWMNYPDAYQAVQAIAPAVLFVALMSAFRGYYQGHGNMMPTAVSQVIEALCKLGVGYITASVMFNAFQNAAKTPDVIAKANQMLQEALSKGEDFSLSQAFQALAGQAAAPGALIGISVGSVLGALYLFVHYRRRAEKFPLGAAQENRGNRRIFKELLRLSIPVTISASVLNLSNLIDVALVKARLVDASGFSETAAETMYGSYTYAQNLFNLPSAFILTLAVSVIPAIATALAKNDKASANQTIRSSLRVTSLLAMPAAAGLIALAFPLLFLLNGARQPEAVAIAWPLLRTLGFAVPFVCLVSLTNSILQAMGMVSVPILNMLVGGLLKIAINYVLVGNPAVNIAGAPVGTLVCYAVISLLNLIVIARVTRSVRFLGVFVKPVLASALMGGAAYSVHSILTAGLGFGNSIAVLLTIGVAFVVYLILILALRALPKEDLLLIPKGEKLAKLLKL